MANNHDLKTEPNGPMVYEIRVQGHLGHQWADWFGGVTITLEDNGNTLLTVSVADQAALHGLLKKVRDLGTPLISVSRVEPSPPVTLYTNQADVPEINKTRQYHSKKKQRVNIHKGTAEMKDKKMILSTLWIFAMLNYLYCDVMSLMDPGFLKQYLNGNVGGIQLTSGFFLGAAILMEIPTAMVLLSRVLRHGANRLANIIAGAIMTIIQFSSLFFGSSPTIYYIFFSVIEIVCTAFIVWYAWKWTSPEGSLDKEIK